MERQENEGLSFPLSFGRYVLLRRLGEGGMSTVYLGEQRGHGGFARTVAVKTLHPHLAAHPEVAQLFIGEARLGGHLVHPNVVQTLDFGEESGQLFLAMEYIHGLTLAQVTSAYRENRRYVPQDIALDVMIRVAQGLGYAHKARDSRGTALNMVHRDLKPSNILLGRHGEVKVCDFGVARSTSSVLHTQASGMLRGTCRYMSPEQAWGRRDLDRRSDLFALGLVLFEALTLEPLYHQRQNEAVLRFAQDAVIEERLERLPRTPIRGELLAILRRALAKEREERYQWAEDLVQDLMRVRSLLPQSRTLGSWMSEALAMAGAPERLEPSPYAIPQLDDEDEDSEATPTVRLVPPKVQSPIFQDEQAAKEIGSQPQTMAARRAPEEDIVNPPPRKSRGAVILVALVGLLGLGAGLYGLLGGAASSNDKPPPLVNTGPDVQLASKPVVLGNGGGTTLEDVTPVTLFGGSAEAVAPSAYGSGAGEPVAAPVALAPKANGETEGVALAEPQAGPRATPKPSSNKPANKSTQKVAPQKPPTKTTPPPKQAPASQPKASPKAQVAPAPAPASVVSLSQCDGAPSGAGALLLNARPPAAVTLDGRSLGTSPVCAPSVAPGAHKLTFVVPGQPPMTHTITAKPGVVARCTAFFSKYSVSCRED